ncbi:hypothetical protein [Prosthecobacter sp.]|uniref:hypothetical protein n=1 Tax=Prosthecobacter sp. TaxID=1965333 RepID=UPI0037845484
MREERPPERTAYAVPAPAQGAAGRPPAGRLPLPPLGWLLLIALCAGLGWRAEVEIRGGWAGMRWAEYFHRAVPVGLLAFALWVWVVARVRRRGAFAVALVVFSVVGYMGMRRLVFYFFASGPSALWAILDLGRGDLLLGEQRRHMLVMLAPVVWGLVPLGFSVLCRGFGVPVKPFPVLVSTGLFYLSWPLAIFVRSFFDQRGGADLIHALKSGYLIPFLILSLGLPVLAALPRRSGPPA